MPIIFQPFMSEQYKIEQGQLNHPFFPPCSATPAEPFSGQNVLGAGGQSCRQLQLGIKFLNLLLASGHPKQR